MYVCTYIHTYIHTYVRTYVRTYVHMYICMYVCTYVRTYVCMHVCTYVRTYVCMYVCIFSFRFLNSIYLPTSLFIHRYMSFHPSMSVCISVYLPIAIYPLSIYLFKATLRQVRLHNTKRIKADGWIIDKTKNRKKLLIGHRNSGLFEHHLVLGVAYKRWIPNRFLRFL